MILLSIEAKDDISETDPLTLSLEFEDDACWLDVRRLGVLMLSQFSAYWQHGQWWRKTVEKDLSGEMVAAYRPSDSDELAEHMAFELAKRYELAGRVHREEIRVALDESRVALKAMILEVMKS